MGLNKDIAEEILWATHHQFYFPLMSFRKHLGDMTRAPNPRCDTHVFFGEEIPMCACSNYTDQLRKVYEDVVLTMRKHPDFHVEDQIANNFAAIETVRFWIPYLRQHARPQLPAVTLEPVVEMIPCSLGDVDA